MSNVSQELKQNALFIFVNFIICMFLFISFKGLLNKDCRRVLVISLGGKNYKWFIVQLCLSLSNGIKYNLDEK